MTAYHGGKQAIGEQIAKQISQVTFALQDSIQIKGYCEPFCGMLGVYTHIPKHLNKLNIRSKLKFKAGDTNNSVIEFWKSVINTDWLPTFRKMTESKRDSLQSAREKGFWGHQASFGGLYYGQFRSERCTKSKFDHALENIKSIRDDLSESSIKFTNGSYTQFSKLKNYVIYCDPPYAKNNVYYSEDRQRIRFNSTAFWEWCNEMAKDNLVFVSEYSIPSFITAKRYIVRKTKTSYGKSITKNTEKLFLVIPQFS
jgi:site-specific DNA-adenine methylase